jgi:hypothetical protein
MAPHRVCEAWNQTGMKVAYVVVVALLPRIKRASPEQYIGECSGETAGGCYACTVPE